MKGGGYDVTRLFAAKLDDVFAKIGLDGRYAFCQEMRVQLNLFGHHGFALGDTLYAGIFQNTRDDRTRLVRVARHEAVRHCLTRFQLGQQPSSRESAAARIAFAFAQAGIERANALARLTWNPSFKCASELCNRVS